MRRLTTELATWHAIPYIVHLEDNENVIAADQLDIPRDRLLNATETEISAASRTPSHIRIAPGSSSPARRVSR